MAARINISGKFCYNHYADRMAECREEQKQGTCREVSLDEGATAYSTLPLVNNMYDGRTSYHLSSVAAYSLLLSPATRLQYTTSSVKSYFMMIES